MVISISEIIRKNPDNQPSVDRISGYSRLCLDPPSKLLLEILTQGGFELPTPGSGALENWLL